MGIGCRIITDFDRPDKTLVERFRGLQVADLDDNMARTQAVRHKIVSFSAKPLLGTAFTVKLPHGDNLLFRAAIRYIKPGVNVKPYLREADSTALQSSIRFLSDAWNSFFDGRTEKPVFHKKGKKDSYTSRNNKGSIRAIVRTMYRYPNWVLSR